MLAGIAPIPAIFGQVTTRLPAQPVRRPPAQPGPHVIALTRQRYHETHQGLHRTPRRRRQDRPRDPPLPQALHRPTASTASSNTALTGLTIHRSVPPHDRGVPAARLTQPLPGTHRSGRARMPDRPLVAGVDTSTQSSKVVVCDAETGEVLREGRAAHPDGTEVDPRLWWAAGRRRAPTAPGRRARDRRRRAAARHDPARRGRRGRAPRRAVERHPLGARRRRPHRRAGRPRRGPTRSGWCRWPASRSPSCAGSPATSPRARGPDRAPACCRTTG